MKKLNIKNPEDVLNFWFDPENTPKHFIKDPTFDQEIKDLFFETWEASCQGLLNSWRNNSRGRLAEIIVLDQFSRNLMRGDWRSYSQDQMALVLAQELLKQDDYNDLGQAERRFGLMPFMHSESAAIHEEAIVLFEELGDESTLHYEKLHKDVIDRFGRYPHRNAILGRKSTKEELDYIAQGGGF